MITNTQCHNDMPVWKNDELIFSSNIDKMGNLSLNKV